MTEKEYAVGLIAPDVVITDCAGDLTVEGWAEPRIVIDSEEAPIVKLSAGGITVSFEDDARMMIPFATQLRMENVQGDARLRDLEKAIEAGSCEGDLTIRHCGAVKIAEVHGDVRASRLSGVLRVDHVSGDAVVRHSTSGVFLVSDGDISILAPIPEAQLQAQGDVRLVLQPEKNSKSNVRAGGNLQCFLQLPASVKIQAHAESAVQVRPPLTTTSSDSKGCSLAVGVGEAELALESQGSMEIGGWMETEYFKEWEADLGRWGMEFGAVASEWGRWLDGKLRDKMEDMDRLMKKHMSASDFSRPRSRGAWDANPARSRGASESERMSVLQMLQDGKISVDEADRLLATLDGRRAG
jgi:hypothetical protein